MHRSLPGKWLVLLLALLLIGPMLVVITAPFHTPTANLLHALTYTLPHELLGTVRLMVGCALLAILFGAITAWLVSIYDFPGRGFFRWALVLPLGLPTYIGAYIYGDLLGPTGKWSLALSDTVKFDVMNELGLMVVMAAVLYPYVYLPSRALFAYGSGQLQEAARTLGAGELRLFLRVGLPLARPAIAGGALLVAMEVMNDYGAVKFFGVQTLTTGIFKSWFNMGDLGLALRIGAIMLLMVLLLRYLERRAQAKRERSYSPHPTVRKRLSNGNSWLMTLACLIPLTLGAVIPLYKITTDLIAGHWRKALEYDLLEVLHNTLVLGVSAAFTTLMIAIVFSYAARHGRDRLMNGLMSIASLGYVVPGAVIAVGVMTVAGIWDRNIGFGVLIGSLALLVIALAVRFLAVAQEPIRSTGSSISPTLDESARILGAGPIRRYLRIDLPLLKRGMVVGALFVFIEVVKELPLTLILRPFNFDTLATKAYELAGIELLQESSAAAACIVICSMLPVYLLERTMNRN